jgi:hypothetical protein
VPARGWKEGRRASQGGRGKGRRRAYQDAEELRELEDGEEHLKIRKIKDRGWMVDLVLICGSNQN